MDEFSMRSLVNKLNDATKAYDKGEPYLSDEEWDNMYFQLDDMEKKFGIVFPDSPTHNIIFQTVSELTKVKHNHPMLSLNKTKEIKDIEAFVKGKDWVIMSKMDGLTCSLRYVDGKLVSAETRGDGIEGEDINNDTDSNRYYNEKFTGLNNMQARLNSRGGTDQWTRMRQDKLRGLMKSLLYSYQSAIVQEYNVTVENLITNIVSIISLLENNEELSDDQNAFLDDLKQEYTFLSTDRSTTQYIYQLKNVAELIENSQPLFRCLINHDKLKVDYEDKIISIPFFEPPIGKVDPIETNFHNGTVFKWVHGNKEEWTPDTYWIVYMQYSEQTAYFRAEIRKADQEIEIIVIDEQGNENSVTYRGWMTGPNETSIVWNTKKGVAWNDMNYTKLLYITKDENTLAFFERFDRVVINGKPWEVQAYNDSYGNSADADSGIIRVALKETYTSTDQFIKQLAAAAASQTQDDEEVTQAEIFGPASAKPYDVITFTAKGFEEVYNWSVSDSTLAKIKSVSEDGITVKIEIITGTSNKEGFYINYGDSETTKKQVVIESL